MGGPLFPKQLVMKLSLTIRAKSPLSVGAGKAETLPGIADMPVIRDPRTGLPVIPGSTIKGFLRGYLTKIFSAVHSAEKVQKFVEKLFGSQKQASLVYFEDAFPETPVRTEVRAHIRINPVTGGVANLFTREYVVEGAKFKTEVTFVNTPLSILGVFCILRDLSEHGVVRIGGAKSRGYGQVEVRPDEMKLLMFAGEDHVALKLFGGKVAVEMSTLRDSKTIRIEEKLGGTKENYELHYVSMEDHVLYRMFHIKDVEKELESNYEKLLSLIHSYINNV